MAGISGWYGTPYTCEADPSKSHGVGWYVNGVLISSSYNNPTTGKPWTSAELNAAGGGGAGVATTTAQTGVTSTIPTTSQLEVSPSGVTYDPNTGILTNPQYGLVNIPVFGS